MDSENKRFIKYILIAFAVTYVFWGGLAVFIMLGFFTFTHPAAVIMHLIGGFGPTIAALFTYNPGGKISVKSLDCFLFNREKGTLKYLIAFSAAFAAVIGFSSMELNSGIPLYYIPVILLQAVFIYGGNEELGWRGVMQPMMEERFSFPAASLFTGIIWGIWHIPLWFVDGASQQNIHFALFIVLAVILSFLYGAVYKKTKYLFGCCIMHGLTNTLLSVFVIKINIILIIGLLIILVGSIYLWYSGGKRDEPEKIGESLDQ